MKKIFLVLLFSLFCSKVFAINVFYDLNTGNILTIGNLDIQETETIKRCEINDNNPILKEDLKTLKWDAISKGIVKKSTIDIQSIEKDKTKMAILLEYRSLRKQLEDLKKDVADGFDPIINEQELLNKISELKTRYQTENSKQIK